ncbi:MAG: hypothetical protein WCZ26_07610 [Methanothrix soehngenii]|jgi:hypothetical protein|uniref:hypothetical protein n=1 Tax=Methanothrix soehngenii TaxID=2223 RepID=UPI0023F10322|nr:hypothetical protein [Methanothrix soehngenii]MDD5258330.1 hypothetical protein [Methanothrix soehngenii]
MKKMILLILALCFGSLVGVTLSQNDEVDNAATMTVLKQDSGTNLSLMNTTTYSAARDWGIDAFAVGEAVKFTAPEPGWELKQIRIVGWNGFNETSRTVPSPNNFLIEIRDANLDLLYRMADTQNAYFTYAGPVLRAIDIPTIPVTGDFYVVFYDRGAMVIGMELGNATGNSYFYDSMYSQLVPVKFTDEDNVTTEINWIIRAVGE